AVAHRSRNDLACEGEQQSRAFDHYQGVHVFLRDILDAENAGIDQLESEQQLAVGLRLAVELEFDFLVGLGQRRGVHVDLNVDRGLLPRCERLRRIGVLEGEILGVLRQNIELRLLALPAVAGDGHCSSLTREAELPPSGGVANTAGPGGQEWDLPPGPAVCRRYRRDA